MAEALLRSTSRSRNPLSQCVPTSLAMSRSLVERLVPVFGEGLWWPASHRPRVDSAPASGEFIVVRRWVGSCRYPRYEGRCIKPLQVSQSEALSSSARSSGRCAFAPGSAVRLSRPFAKVWRGGEASTSPTIASMSGCSKLT